MEIDINCEEDIQNLVGLNLDESPRIKFFNFIQERTGDYCQGKCGSYHRTPPKPQEPIAEALPESQEHIAESLPKPQRLPCRCNWVVSERWTGMLHIIDGRKVVSPSHCEALAKFKKMPLYYNSLPRFDELAGLRPEDYLQDPEEETEKIS